MKLADKYRNICSVKIGCGDSALFWSDNWSGKILQDEFPRLYSFAVMVNNSVQDVILVEDRTSLFQLPLSPQAFIEFQNLQLILDQTQINLDCKDVWLTIWKDGVYTSSKYYQHCFKGVVASKIYHCIWACKALLRIKVFAWLLVSDRINTRDMLRRRHLNVTNVFHCVLCPCRATEDWQHLFFHCNFSVRVWSYLQIEWESGSSFEAIFMQARRKFNKPFFTEVVILAAWHIWKQRNEAIFQGILPTFRGWRRRFIHEVTLHMHRVKTKHTDIFSSWISSLI
jgi:hypothetical protein